MHCPLMKLSLPESEYVLSSIFNSFVNDRAGLPGVAR
jgi:hypothetical protein